MLIGIKPGSLKNASNIPHDAARLGSHTLHLVVLVQLLAQKRLQRVIELARAVAEADERLRMRPDLGDRTHAGGTEARGG